MMNLEKMEAIVQAAENLVRCKGRYHSEQNMTALAKLFDVELPRFESEPIQQDKRYCKSCASFRAGDTCSKCNSPTIMPHPSFTEPRLPPIEVIRHLAKELGYAIGVHGTQERDLDVIAAPWVENAVSSRELLQHIAKGLNGVVIDETQKTLGRHAATIQINGWFKQLDISVCPIPIVDKEPYAWHVESLMSVTRESFVMHKADAERWQKFGYEVIPLYK